MSKMGKMVTVYIAQRANISLKAGYFFPSRVLALYANIISISEKVKHLFREKEKYDLEMFVNAHFLLWHLRQC